MNHQKWVQVPRPVPRAGVAKSGKAGGFQPSTRGFKSHHPPLFTWVAQLVRAGVLYASGWWFEPTPKYCGGKVQLSYRFHTPVKAGANPASATKPLWRNSADALVLGTSSFGSTGSIPVGGTNGRVVANWEHAGFAIQSCGFEPRLVHRLAGVMSACY